MSIQWLTFEMVINILEIGIDFFLFLHLFPPKQDQQMHKIPEVITGLLIWAWLVFSPAYNIPYSFDFFVYPTFWFIYLLLFRNGHWAIKFFWILLTNVLFASIAYTVTRSLQMLPAGGYEEFFAQTGYRILSVSLIHSIYIVIVWMIVRFNAYKRQRAFANAANLFIICILPIYSIAIMLLIEYTHMQNPSILWQNITIIASVGTFLLNVLVLWLFDRMSKQTQETIRLKTEAYVSGHQIRYHEEMRSTYQQMRVWRHDYHNHLETIKGLLKMGEHERAEEYVAKCSNNFAKIDRFIATGHITLDALLSVKLTHAENMGIPVESVIILPETLPISDTQMCVLLGNLLENAMDACARVKTKERYIHLDIRPQNANLQIKIANATNGQERRIGTSFLTTKESGELHGIGLRSVDAIITSLGGYCQRTHQNFVFTTDILLPLQAAG